MDPELNIISPKPKKSCGNTRKFNIRSSYEHNNLVKFEEVLCDKSYPTSTKNVKDFRESLNQSKSTEFTFQSTLKIKLCDNLFDDQLKFNLFDDIEKELAQNSCQEEILSILSDNRSSIFSQDELSPNMFFNSYSSGEDLKKKRFSALELRPENPAFKNFESKDFLENIKKSISEDFGEL